MAAVEDHNQVHSYKNLFEGKEPPAGGERGCEAYVLTCRTFQGWFRGCSGDVVTYK